MAKHENGRRKRCKEGGLVGHSEGAGKDSGENKRKKDKSKKSEKKQRREREERKEWEDKDVAFQTEVEIVKTCGDEPSKPVLIEGERTKKKKHREENRRRKRSLSGDAEAEDFGINDTGNSESNPTIDHEKSSAESNSINPKFNGSSGGTGSDGKVIDDDETRCIVGGRVVASSATDYQPCPLKAKAVSDGAMDAERDVDVGGVTLLLFYQYVEPPWDKSAFQKALHHVESSGKEHGLTGRMRVAHEGLNCTLTGTYDGVRKWCRDLRRFGERGEFKETEFKLTDHLPRGQLFPSLHAFRVDELVNYGLPGDRAPPIGKTGVHLEPDDYHRKIAEKDTVIIDVRNHYEAKIGQFVPPTTGAEYIDPNMRKSTEFPVWLDKPETKEKLRGKQVLMYCTGGVRCERASALLRQKMETEEDTKALGIKGVYQLQGGIDKYFKKFPEGGWWKGKNYVFDKRFAHAPPAVEGKERAAKMGFLASTQATENGIDASEDFVLGRCEACSKPWDKYRGKRRCPTCGVPSLVCRECMEADASKVKKLGKDVRCDLCVKEGIRSKSQVREKEHKEFEEYELKLKLREKIVPTNIDGQKPRIDRDTSQNDIRAQPSNPDGITRLFLKNMCNRRMDEATLVEFMPGITHIQWIKDRKTGKFFGSAFVEMATPEDAAHAVSLNGHIVLGRPIRVKYEKPDPKDVWPPKHCALRQC